MKAHIRPALVLFAVMTLITGAAYPLLVTALAQLLFPSRANGSLIIRDGKVAGSELIGQSFADPRYFWSRPSATSPIPYNAAASSGSNLGPKNPALVEYARARIAAHRAQSPAAEGPVPVDLVTASGSGLDPHITPAAARYQAPRVAKARNIPQEILIRLINEHVEGRALGILGEPRVNVLRLNLALDGLR